MNTKTLFLSLFAVGLLAIPGALILSDSSDNTEYDSLGSGPVFAYDWPETITAKVNDPTITLRFTDQDVNTTAYYIMVGGWGTTQNNFPSWMSFRLANGTHGPLEIVINPGHVANNMFWINFVWNDGLTLTVNVHVVITPGNPTDPGPDPGPVNYRYTWPSTVYTNYGATEPTILTAPGNWSEISYYVIVTGHGTIESNFPHWITYRQSSVGNYGFGYLEIIINPGSAVDSVFWLLINWHGAKILLDFHLVVSEDGPPEWGGENPIKPDEPDTDDGPVRWFIKTVWDFIAEIFDNTVFLMIIIFGLLGVAVAFRITRSVR